MVRPGPSDGGPKTETHYDRPGRASRDTLRRAVAFASTNPIINTVMASFAGVLAVLNEHRQIVAVNRAFLGLIGVEDESRILGARVGEAVRCIHANDPPDGCGTTRLCSSCGVAVAIVACHKGPDPVERDCILAVERDGRVEDLYLRVRASRVRMNGQRFTLLFMRDVSVDEQWAALERAFLHDISNVAAALAGAAEETARPARDPGAGPAAGTPPAAGADPAGTPRTIRPGFEPAEAIVQIRRLARRLAKEIEVQRTLLDVVNRRYRLDPSEFRLGEALRELRAQFSGHPAARGKTLTLPDAQAHWRLRTDLTLLLRVLTNMTLNALEATAPGGTVRVWVGRRDDAVVFSVWNDRRIHDSVARRIFQRHFSTKSGRGRGLGTYSMKLFGEQYLGGKVWFETSKAAGTTFHLELPAQPLD